ncbi:MAG TPA: segregation/condensation protein A [Planctomycetota bacterium]|nr:segregation/condensation protein A [Planctomycetota bacterium]
MTDAPDATLEAPPVAVPPSDAAPVAPAELDLGYHVTLDSFSGPLDLLLFLVRRTEVDIADIPVSTIADQFVAMLKTTPDLDLDVAGDFILMAATLLELKSRLVMPAEEPKEGDDESHEEEDVFDPRAGLIRQLLVYRRFKEATQLLPELEGFQLERFGRGLREIIPEDPEEVDSLDLENCDAGLLYETWEGVLIYLNRLGPRTVLNDDVPLEHKIHALVDAMRAAREAKLSWMFAQETTTSGRVGVLMATLECARQRFVEALQHEQFGDVLLRYREDTDRTRAPELPPEPLDEPKKRRKRLPLVTWRAPERVVQPEQQELDLDVEEEEAVVETDEQRFHRELEEACAVEAVLTRTADIESSFTAFRTQQQLDAQVAAIASVPSSAESEVTTELAAATDLPPEAPVAG